MPFNYPFGFPKILRLLHSIYNLPIKISDSDKWELFIWPLNWTNLTFFIHNQIVVYLNNPKTCYISQRNTVNNTKRQRHSYTPHAHTVYHANKYSSKANRRWCKQTTNPMAGQQITNENGFIFLGMNCCENGTSWATWNQIRLNRLNIYSDVNFYAHSHTHTYTQHHSPYAIHCAYNFPKNYR